MITNCYLFEYAFRLSFLFPKVESALSGGALVQTCFSAAIVLRGRWPKTPALAYIPKFPTTSDRSLSYS